MKKLKSFKPKNKEEINNFRSIFLTQARSISPQRMQIASHLLMTHKSNRKKINLGTEIFCPSRIDLIKYEKKAHDSIKKHKEGLHIIKYKAQEKEENLEIEIYNAMKNPMGLKDRNFEKKIEALSLKNSSFVKYMRNTIKESKQGLFEKRHSDGRLLTMIRSPSAMENRSLLINNHLKTHLYTECLQNGKPEIFDFDSSDTNICGKIPLDARRLVNGFTKSVKTRQLVVKPGLKKRLASPEILVSYNDKLERKSYTKNNENLQSVYFKLYKRDVDLKTHLRNTLNKLKVPGEWKKYASGKYGNYDNNFFTKFLVEKQFIGTPY